MKVDVEMGVDMCGAFLFSRPMYTFQSLEFQASTRHNLVTGNDPANLDEIL